MSFRVEPSYSRNVLALANDSFDMAPAGAARGGASAEEDGPASIEVDEPFKEPPLPCTIKAAHIEQRYGSPTYPIVNRILC